MESNKKELRAVLIKIIGYVLVMGLFENIYAGSQSEMWRIVPAGLILLVLLLDIRHKKERFSVVALSEFPYGKRLYLLPMAVVATANLWHGAVLRFSPINTVFYVAAMLVVGAIEELLFRGYLFRLLEKRSVKMAILVSSLTFGLGHIVNLVNGAQLLPTLLQLVYAFAIGLMLSVFMAKAGNILPCCIFHGIFNALAAFSNELGQTIGYQVVVCIIVTGISVGYALYLWTSNTMERKFATKKVK